MATSPTSFLNERDRELLATPALSVPDAVRILNVSRSNLYTSLRAGTVPSLRVGTSIRIPTIWVRKQLLLDDVAEVAEAGA